MKQVWICDFCEQTDKDAEFIKKHETECKYNPINKKCATCNHEKMINDYDGNYFVCEKHDFTHYESVEDDEIKCEDYEQEIKK